MASYTSQSKVGYCAHPLHQQTAEDDMADPFIDVPTTLWNRMKQKINTPVPLQWSVEGWTYDRVDFQINYSNLAVQSSQLVSLDQSEFNNCTIVQADETWQRDKKTTDTYTFTNKTGFKIAGLKFPIQI